MKLIDADKLKAKIKGLNLVTNTYEEQVAFNNALAMVVEIIDSLQQEHHEVDLEKFTEKMDAWKARYSSPDDVPIKGTMAFTARMFYMYPKVAREWYDSLPKVTLD